MAAMTEEQRQTAANLLNVGSGDLYFVKYGKVAFNSRCGEQLIQLDDSDVLDYLEQKAAQMEATVRFMKGFVKRARNGE